MSAAAHWWARWERRLCKESSPGAGYGIGGASQIVTFAVLTAIASLLPIVGTGAVWGPIGVYELCIGHVFGGIFILVWGACVVMTMTDYVIRPYLVGRGHGHPLLVLIALLGGFEVLGMAGLIVAPILMSLFVAVLRIYEREFIRPPAS